MAWICYQKIYDIVPQTLIRERLKIYKLSDKIINLIEIMKNCQVELTETEQTLTDLKIQREVFHGDSLSLLLIIITMMPFNHILRKSIADYKFTK